MLAQLTNGFIIIILSFSSTSKLLITIAQTFGTRSHFCSPTILCLPFIYDLIQQYVFFNHIGLDWIVFTHVTHTYIHKRGLILYKCYVPASVSCFRLPSSLLDFTQQYIHLMYRQLNLCFRNLLYSSFTFLGSSIAHHLFGLVFYHIVVRLFLGSSISFAQLLPGCTCLYNVKLPDDMYLLHMDVCDAC